MLPPLGLGAMLPVACRRCIHLIAELGLTSNQSAASRRDAPYSTASTTRSRNSKEHGFGIDPPSKTRINARQIQLSKPAGESRFNSAEIRSSTLEVRARWVRASGRAVGRRRFRVMSDWAGQAAGQPCPQCPVSDGRTEKGGL